MYLSYPIKTQILGYILENITILSNSIKKHKNIPKSPSLHKKLAKMRLITWVLIFFTTLTAGVEISLNSSFKFGWEYVDSETIHMTFTVTF